MAFLSNPQKIAIAKRLVGLLADLLTSWAATPTEGEEAAPTGSRGGPTPGHHAGSDAEHVRGKVEEILAEIDDGTSHH